MKHKICKRCGVDKPIDSFKIDVRTKNGYSSNCKKCQKKLNAYWKNRRAQGRKISTIYDYLMTLRRDKSHCMRCGRLFNDIVKEILISKRRYKTKEIKRKSSLHWNYWKGFYLCDECYKDKLQGKRFKIKNKDVGIEDITPQEYAKIFKNYIKPYE